MNTMKQIGTLLKFQAAVSPFVWVIPFALCTPLLFMLHDEPSLNLLILTQNLFMVLLLGALVLAPEIFTTASNSQAGGLGSEFILTRAVDRKLLARAKAIFFYLIALVAPIALILYALMRQEPSLHAAIDSKAGRLDCLQHIAGSTLLKGRDGRADLVAIPSGNVLVATWRSWEFLVLAILVQVFVYAIHPLRYRRYCFWALILLVSLAPAFGTLSSYRGSIPWDEHFFFCYAANQSYFWIPAIAALFLGQAWCERRFARLEQ
jgi:hypothetical protein